MKRREHGFALVVALVLLAAATLLAMSSLHSAALGDRMTGAIHDRSLARLAAEAALRDARNDLDGLRADGAACPAGEAGCRAAGERPIEERRGGPGDSLASADCSAGQCSYADDAASSPWRRFLSSGCDPVAAVPLGRYTGAAAMPDVREQPCYLLEIVRVPGSTPDGRYLIRITARGVGMRAGTVVMLQQTMSRPNA